jgi:hypothetical protein
MKISITRTDTGLQVCLHGDPHHFERALDTLKQEIPRQGCKFDAEQRCWVIDHKCQGELERWLGRMRCEIKADVVYRNKHQNGRSEPTTHHQITNAYATLHLLSTAPPELVKAAYRCLAMINHPDHGGDTEAMQQINNAYARLSARRA